MTQPISNVSLRGRILSCNSCSSSNLEIPRLLVLQQNYIANLDLSL